MGIFDYMARKNLSSRARLLMLVLLHKVDGYYGWEDLAERVGVTVNTLEKLRQELVDAGLLSYVRRYRGGVYTILLDGRVLLPSFKSYRKKLKGKLVYHEEMQSV